MEAKNNDWVSVTYEGRFTNNEVFDKNSDSDPLYFQIGANQVIKGFENAVLGLEEGKEKEITIDPKEGYGEKNTQINEIPKEAFANQDLTKIKLNEELNIMSNMGPLVVEIKEIGDTMIKAIINHPMAGKQLIFKIKLLKILNENEVKELQEKMSQHSCSCCSDESCACEEEGHSCSCEHDHEENKE